MGMFDSFWGEYKCDYCGNNVKFEEQTKDYGRLLENFYLGDYCDRANKNYFYEFESWCANCHTKHDMCLAIRRGQYVGIYYKYEADEMDIMDLDNIEEGYWRNREYDKMCEKKIGEEKITGEKLKQKHVGESIEALRTNWKILEVYKIKPSEKENLFLKLVFYHKTYIYRVTDGVDERLIEMCTTEINPSEVFLEVKDDDLDACGLWDGESLVRLE